MNVEVKKEKEWEQILRVKTTGRDDSRSDQYRFPYEPTPYVVLKRLANSGWIGKKNVLLDYGCGKGRVDFFLAYQTRCHTIGIEYDERIYQKALENKEAAGCGERVNFSLANAENYPVQENVDRIYFFNPFSVELLRSVVRNIMESYDKNPREIFLFFYFPSDEYIAFLMSHLELEFVDEIDCSDFFTREKERERILIMRKA